MNLQEELVYEIIKYREQALVEFISDLHKMLNIEIEIQDHKPVITQSDKVTHFIKNQTFIARVNGEVVLERTS